MMTMMTLPIAWMKGKRNKTTLQIRKGRRRNNLNELPDPVDGGIELEDPHLEQGLHDEHGQRSDTKRKEPDTEINLDPSREGT